MAMCVLAVLAWSTVPAAGLFLSSADNLSSQCTQMSANLTGTATAGTTPRGTAKYKETGKDRLQVDVRSVNLPAGTNLDVMINDTNVGSIALPRNGNGQLKVDAPTVTVADGATIVVRNGTADVMAGTFACGGNASSNSKGKGNSKGNSDMNMNSHMNNMNSHMNMNSNSNNSNSDMNMNSNSNNSNSNMNMNSNSNNSNSNMNMNSNVNK
jgi:hypothetical protein